MVSKAGKSEMKAPADMASGRAPSWFMMTIVYPNMIEGVRRLVLWGLFYNITNAVGLLPL